MDEARANIYGDNNSFQDRFIECYKNVNKILFLFI